MKTIIAISGRSSAGKTETIREFAKQLIAAYPSHKTLEASHKSIPKEWDFRLVVEIKGKVIAMESQGDPGTKLKERLEYLINTYHCDIIICSCRTRGSTVWSIDKVSHAKDYEVIWTSTYIPTVEAWQEPVNEAKGGQLIDLIHLLGLL